MVNRWYQPLKIALKEQIFNGKPLVSTIKKFLMVNRWYQPLKIALKEQIFNGKPFALKEQRTKKCLEKKIFWG